MGLDITEFRLAGGPGLGIQGRADRLGERAL